MKIIDEYILVLASTGASGARLSLSFLKTLTKSQRIKKIFFVYSLSFLKVFKEEEKKDFLKEIKKIPRGKVEFFDETKIDAPISSGSNFFNAMVILPASMGTVGAIANGYSNNLIERCADVCLKEERKLIISPRETPLSSIHLKNLLTLKLAGATILPFIPQYYSNPKTIDDLEAQFFQRILDHLSIDQRIGKRWKNI